VDAPVEGDCIVQARDSVSGPRWGVDPLPISTNTWVVHATMIARMQRTALDPNVSSSNKGLN
jgi:hypothetical protein